MNERIRQKLAARKEARAARLVDEFAAYGEPHLWLACHAAFPLALTPDLLYQIWVNFDVDVNGRYLHIPWIAVADLLLSGLCREVGYELYEMENETRQELLRRLDAHPRFRAPTEGMPSPRRRELAYFLLAYTAHHLRRDDPDDLAGQHLAKAQRWAALAHLHPRQAARELAEAFAQEVPADNRAEIMRLATLTDNFAAELRQFRELLTYASSMAAFAGGDVATAAAQMGGREQPEVAGVPLYVPAAVQRGVDEATLVAPMLDQAGEMITDQEGNLIVTERKDEATDQIEVEPDETFFHTWYLHNSGSRTWGEGYRVVHYRGEALGPITAVPLPPAAPGETVEVELKLSAPNAPGRYGTVWRPRNPEGILFGPELRLTVEALSPFPETMYKTGSAAQVKQAPEGDRDPARRLYEALLTLNFAAQAAAFREALARRPGGGVFLIHGPPEHGQRWLTHRLRAREVGEVTVRAIYLAGLGNVAEGAPERVWPYVGREIGLEGWDEMMDGEITKNLMDRLAGETAVIVLDELEKIPPYTQAELAERLWRPLSRFVRDDGIDGRFFLFLLAHDWLSPPETSLPLTVLPPLEPISLEALYEWWDRARQDIRPLLPPQEREIPEDEWLEMLWKSSDAGRAEELFRQLCRRAGLDWRQIVTRWLDDLQPPTLE